MMVRSRKTNRESHYDLDDFLLKEFSKDKEIFVADTELSCNECWDREDHQNHKDSILSFLVKFKADHSKDPKAIRAKSSGFILPKALDYRKHKSDSLFTSVSENHHNLHIRETDLRAMGAQLYAEATSQRTYTKDEVKLYLRRSHSQKDWQNLLSRPDRTKWRIFIAKTLKSAFKEQFGKVDDHNVKDGIRLDEEGFWAMVQEIEALQGFDPEELKVLARYRPS